MEAAVVREGDPLGGRQLDLLDRALRTAAVDEFGLVEPVDALGQGVVEAVALALNARPRKTLAWKTPAEAFDDLLHSAYKAVLPGPLEPARDRTAGVFATVVSAAILMFIVLFALAGASGLPVEAQSDTRLAFACFHDHPAFAVALFANSIVMHLALIALAVGIYPWLASHSAPSVAFGTLSPSRGWFSTSPSRA